MQLLGIVVIEIIILKIQHIRQSLQALNNTGQRPALFRIMEDMEITSLLMPNLQINSIKK
jgi:hypothetical protein